MNTIHNLPRLSMGECIDLLISNGNTTRNVNLDVIAKHQGFDRASFAARFAELQTQMSLRACGECEK
jgi:hypothetical protein